MFLPLALIAFGLTWLLQVLGLFSTETVGLVGASLVIFAGLLRLIHMKKRRAHDHDIF